MLVKIWYGFGSEHSNNLVMIGHFKDARNAEKVQKLLDRLVALVAAESTTSRQDSGPEDNRFSADMREFLAASNLYSIAPSELEQFAYDVSVHVENSKIVVKTDEIDVSAFLKVLLNRGAKVEVYSAHDYPDAESNDD